MDNKKVINNLFNSISKMVNKLSNEELGKIESGKFDVLLSFPKGKSEKLPQIILDEKSIMDILSKIDSAKSREEGLEILESNIKNKSGLEIFAKHIDVAVSKSDRVEKIKANIIDATVGARLRSSAIQGKEI